MTIEMKYLKNGLNLFIAVSWVIIALMGLGVILCFTMTPLSLGAFLILPLIQIVLSIMLSVMHFSVYFGIRTYIYVDNDILYKDCGMVRPKARIKISDINNKMAIGSTLRLSDHRGREFKINLDCLRIDDYLILKEKLNMD